MRSQVALALVLSLVAGLPVWADGIINSQSVGGTPSGSAGGDLGGTYPNPTVVNGSHITNASIPNSGLANPSVTVNGTTCILGSTCTPPAANTPESFCSGSVYAASSAVSFMGICKTVVAVTVDNIEAVTGTVTASSGIVFTVYDCGTSAGACSSPTSTIGSVTTSNTSSTAVDGSVSTAAVAAGHYIEIKATGGTCTVCQYTVSVAMH